MQLPPRRSAAILLKRYKRFLADVRLADGRELTIHCPNSGSMRGCSAPGSPVIISHSDNPRRKYAWTLEMIQVDNSWIGVNTSLTNRLVHEALANGTIDDFGTLKSIRAEVKVSTKSRLDFLLEGDRGQSYLEVKNCSLAEEGLALFPDAVTARGTRHLEELITLVGSGYGAAVLFCIQRQDAEAFAPAAAIDPLYAATLSRAAQAGVRVLAYQARVEPEEISIVRHLPVNLVEGPSQKRLP
ncbi:DNA/RNA nuclease SfsA [Desulfogranum mediterraneum]|uniref:DNA/RNA nuclease SfsA n=1 Tax=Desulfogranum mediterraneum TaxID=160661 RepID=UPI00041CDB9D|nr:DNA/RNA nuclease SfsA [Desulfogranum mediterraneum]